MVDCISDSVRLFIAQISDQALCSITTLALYILYTFLYNIHRTPQSLQRPPLSPPSLGFIHQHLYPSYRSPFPSQPFAVHCGNWFARCCVIRRRHLSLGRTRSRLMAPARLSFAATPPSQSSAARLSRAAPSPRSGADQGLEAGE